ncbi:MAG: ribonuclease HII [Chloroflexi bacterium]|nr:ribonuclease HII [Chloroflexota bacterium]
MAIRPHPTLAHERQLYALGAQRVAGVDEVGRGAVAGPVAAAAVVLPRRPQIWYDRVFDSKDLTAQAREEISALVVKHATVGIAMIPAAGIAEIGIVPATVAAMTRAVRALGVGVDGIVVDALVLPELPARQLSIIHGDQLSLSVACAAIVAKVARDRLMGRLDGVYPGYGMQHHKGYGTSAHMDAIRRLGLSPLHRVGFLQRIVASLDIHSGPS